MKIDEIMKVVIWVKIKVEVIIFIIMVDGLVDIIGFKYGIYYLEEIVVFDDYVLLINWIEFVVNE